MAKLKLWHICILVVAVLTLLLSVSPAACASVAPDPNKVPRMITCTFWGQDGTQMSFNWNTTDYCNSDVQVVEATDSLGFASANVINQRGTFHKSLASNADGYIHTCVVGGLKLGTKYLYRVGDAELNTWGEAGSFVTESGKADSFTFIHVSDPQATSEAPYNIYKEVLRAANQKFSPRFVVNTGDIVNNNWVGSMPNLDQWEWALTGTYEVMKDCPIVASAGNHEAAQYDFLSRFNFDLPEDFDSTSGPYYSFNYNNVHFFVLNTNDTTNQKSPTDATGLSDKQIAWLTADLQANQDADWIVGIMHKGIYDAGDGCYNLEGTNYDIEKIRAQLAPLFTQYKVDLLLQGHDHIYSRTYPIATTVGADGNLVETVTTQKFKKNYNGGTYDFYQDPVGTIYINSGTGSGFKAFKPIADYSKTLYDDAGDGTIMYTAITVDGNTMFVQTFVFDGHYNSILRCAYGIQKSSVDTPADVQPKLTAGQIELIVFGCAAVSVGVALGVVFGRKKHKKQ